MAEKEKPAKQGKPEGAGADKAAAAKAKSKGEKGARDKGGSKGEHASAPAPRWRR